MCLQAVPLGVQSVASGGQVLVALGSTAPDGNPPKEGSTRHNGQHSSIGATLKNSHRSPVSKTIMECLLVMCSALVSFRFWCSGD